MTGRMILHFAWRPIRNCRLIAPGRAIHSAAIAIRGDVMRLPRRSICASLLGALALLLPAGVARAADWPSRPVRIIVPFGASGVTDIVTRIVFDKVGQQL